MMINDISESDTWKAARIYSALLLNFQLSASATLEVYFSALCSKYSVISPILQGRQQLEEK